jgi:hypothetical protein
VDASFSGNVTFNSSASRITHSNLLCETRRCTFRRISSHKKVRDGADALRADPKHYHLDFENDQIRVLRLTLKGDEVVLYSRRCAPGCGFYDAKDALLVCLKECHLGLEYPTKDKYNHTRIQDIDIEAGKSRWILGNLRFVRNLISEPLELLLIEPKVIESSK